MLPPNSQCGRAAFLSRYSFPAFTEVHLGIYTRSGGVPSLVGTRAIGIADVSGPSALYVNKLVLTLSQVTGLSRWDDRHDTTPLKAVRATSRSARSAEARPVRPDLQLKGGTNHTSDLSN